MAFNFNWSPLMADTSRAREMLTAALNKYPKPPIIVDDIIVTELNLGETPPDLEILEIGDLAEDRFRGIFKMSYTGDAFLTLKTRVQANPLNTYLSTKPSWTSPQPLAAASGLTIPLQITLSDIRLSGFVILVFSRQKGLTLVFRNDPLESLKVSSTFDSIPFVRDYLQREIEKQLRSLFMEDLPAILHRLSLRLWSPEYREMDDRLMDTTDDTTIPIDPLASPPQDPVDWLGVAFEESQVPSYSLDAGGESHASFSQKNLLRLAALTESHRTLALFTPPIRDAVFRAWAGASEHGAAASGIQTPIHHGPPSLSRMSSHLGSTTATSSVLSDAGGSDIPTRPTLSSSTSYTFHNSATNRPSAYGHRQRKAKKRVINLRRTQTAMEPGDIVEASGTATSGTPSTTPEPSIAPSSAPSIIYEDQQNDLVTPPRTPKHARFGRRRASSLDGVSPDATPRASIVLPNQIPKSMPAEVKAMELEPPAYTPPPLETAHHSNPAKPAKRPSRPTYPTSKSYAGPKSYSGIPSSSSVLSSSSAVAPSLLRTLSTDKMAFGQLSPGLAGGSGLYSPPPTEGSSGGILEQAWMMKMAREIARKVEEERGRDKREQDKGSAGVRRRSDKNKSGEGGKRPNVGDVDGLSDAPPAYAV